MPFNLLSNQELSGAKSAFQGETVGVCSSYKRRGQPPYNLHAAHFRFIGIFPQSHYKQQYHLRPTVGLRGNLPRLTVAKMSVIMIYLDINYIM